MRKMTIRDVLDLPTSTPRCSARIQDYNDDQVCREVSIRDLLSPDRVRVLSGDATGLGVKVAVAVGGEQGKLEEARQRLNS